jgi:ubiquinone/menaquinone biosynthesis C-methylase UbiE
MSPVCPSWLSFILYNPIRKAFTDREKILDECGVTKDSVVLEVGAGNGFLTEAIAERAKKVYTVELQDGMVRKLQKRVLRFTDKVSIIHGDIASVILKEEVFDICLMYYSFHEVSNKMGAADNISRAVKTGGILSIYEPAMEVEKLKWEKTSNLFEQRGFKKDMERAGIFTRFMRLKKYTANT